MKFTRRHLLALATVAGCRHRGTGFSGYALVAATGSKTVAVIALLLVYEHSLVRPDNLARVNQAFFHVNAVVSLGLLVIGGLDLWL